MAALSFRAAQGAPWVEPGDTSLRKDIELLAAFGVIDGPVNQWPLPWKQVSRSLHERAKKTYPPHVKQAISRVRAAMPQAEDYRGWGGEIRLSASNEPRLVRGFDGGAREEGDVSASVDKHWSDTYAKVSIGWRDDQFGGDVHFDNSYIAQVLFDNWVVYAGTMSQWWGPGWDSALLLSNNARPFPRIGIQRLDPRPFETKWLSWLGNWNFNFTLGRLGGDRTDFDHPLLALIRLSLQPVEGFDIGFSRALQLCGKDRPCGFEMWGRGLLAVGDLDNTGTLDEPGNQIAGIDLRWTDTVAGHAYSLYFETIGEDEDDALFIEYSALVGGTLQGHFSGADLGWQLRLEASDTQEDNWFGLEFNQDPGSGGTTYNNFIYTDGYEFRNRTIGHSLDGDSQLYTAALRLWDSESRSYWLRYRRAIVNATNLNPRDPHEVSSNRETVNVVETGLRAPLGFGRGTAEIRLMDDQPNTPGTSDFTAQFEVTWSQRF